MFSNLFVKLEMTITDPRAAAHDYLIKSMQTKCFPVELNFLKKSKHRKTEFIPLLVSQLNLFIDKAGIIR